jgi:hypothetical protein
MRMEVKEVGNKEETMNDKTEKNRNKINSM